MGGRTAPGTDFADAAQQALGEEETAVAVLTEALALAAPDGLIRPFMDEGAPLARLLPVAAARGVMPDYVRTLLDAVAAETPPGEKQTSQPLFEPLTERELEVLRLIAQGLSNRQIAAQLVLALDTVKGQNRRTYEKLQVRRRTEAVARARALGLI